MKPTKTPEYKSVATKKGIESLLNFRQKISKKRKYGKDGARPKKRGKLISSDNSTSLGSYASSSKTPHVTPSNPTVITPTCHLTQVQKDDDSLLPREYHDEKTRRFTTKDIKC